MSHSQFHSIDAFILRHAWLNLWDKRMLLAESTRLLSPSTETIRCTMIIQSNHIWGICLHYRDSQFRMSFHHEIECLSRFVILQTCEIHILPSLDQPRIPWGIHVYWWTLYWIRNYTNVDYPQLHFTAHSSGRGDWSIISYMTHGILHEQHRTSRGNRIWINPYSRKSTVLCSNYLLFVSTSIQLLR